MMEQDYIRGPETPAPPPDRPVDAGSQALAEALKSSFGMVKVVMVLLVLVFLGSGFFMVGPQERAIILRFGRPVGEGEKALRLPGLQWSFPYPIDDHVKVSITGVQKATSTVGWYATTPEQEMAGTEPPVYPNAPMNPAVDGYVLTADGNIVHSRATVTYRIKDPVRYVFAFVSASNAIQNAVDTALLYAASHFKVDDILTREVATFQEVVRRRVTELAERQDLGVVIEQCSVRSIPPRQIKDAFAEVLKAEVARSKVLNEARGYENQVLSKASADAESRLNQARSDKARLVNDISAEAERFSKLLPKYEGGRSLFTQQRLAETLGRSLTNVQDKIFLTTPQEVRLLINRELPKKPEETKP